MRFSSVSVAVATALSFVSNVHGKKVFAHYMVGTVTEAHAHQDVDDAMAMGLDGFALNIGDPTAQYAIDALNALFGYSEYRGFKLYISMDLYAYGDGCSKAGKTCNKMTDFNNVLGWMQSSAYFRDTPNGQPLVSTFSSGGGEWAEWNAWKTSWANGMYLMPDIDETTGYYSGVDAWWYYWGNITDGVFSWESSWPISATRLGFGGLYAGDTSPDRTVIAAASSRGKGYMMGLSMLQYKDAYGANVYRGGELNLPKRMEGIMGMPIQPDYVQVITWNDGPEGHYIGNLWPESNTDVEPNNYANQEDWPHQPWQGIITSWITAWKAGGGISNMQPLASNNLVDGVMWYKTILQSAVCPNEGQSKYYNKPDNFDTGVDQINYAIVVKSGVSGLKATCYSGGVAIGAVRTLIPGLNYGSCQGVNAGTQRLTVETAGGVLLSAANGVACVSGGCPQGMYNMNYQTASLATDNGAACYDYGQGTFVGGIFVKKSYNPTAAWRSVSCDYGSLTSRYNSGKQMWTDAQTQIAWNDAIYSWKNLKPSGAQFVDYISDFFNARAGLACEQIDNGNCQTTMSCGQGTSPNADVNSPAGYLIMNSFIGIHTGYYNFYSALNTARDNLALVMGNFANTFAPLWNADKSLAIGLDLVAIGFGLIAAGTLNSWVKSATAIKDNPNSLGTVGDSAKLLVVNGIGLAKDTTKTDLTNIKQQNTMSAFLGATVTAWSDILTLQLKTMFDGSDASISTLYTLIDDTNLAFSQNTTSVTDLMPKIEKALLGYMIPVAWSLSTLNVLPFIATTEGVAQASGQTGCNGWDPSKVTGVIESLATDDGIQNFVCGADTENTPYWITNIVDTLDNNCIPTRNDCGGVSFGTLPGISTLGGSGNTGSWAGLTRDDLVISAVNAWKKNGKKNGWAKADPTDGSTLEDMATNGIRATGVVNIPICGILEAFTNVVKGTVTDNYPCN